MSKASELGMLAIVTFLTICIAFAGFRLLFIDDTSHALEVTEGVYTGVSDELMVLLEEPMEEEEEAQVMGARRFSQKITVTTEKGVLPVGGTLIKEKNAFYPGTYELSFSSQEMPLDTKAKVNVAMDVQKGEKVYIVVGDKDSGYREFATVVATENDHVCFSTTVLRDFTLSTTDICSAQQAMNDILSARCDD